ncbi:MAG: phosphatidate cytidylyltransferase [Actinomycetia bacterium]|nr:phosphatidate cytidylyltransferase [Actinomycetes bacterium]
MPDNSDETDPYTELGLDDLPDADQLDGPVGDTWSQLGLDSIPEVGGAAPEPAVPSWSSDPGGPVSDDDPFGLGSVPDADTFHESRPDVGRVPVIRTDDSGPVVGADETSSMPHWTQPPTGEVPAALVGGRAGYEPDESDLETWSGLGTSPGWQQAADDWMNNDDDLLGNLGVERPGGAVIDDAPGTGTPSGGPPQRPAASPDGGEPGDPPGGAAGSPGRNMPMAIGVGVGMAIVALAAFALGSAATVVLVTVVLVLAAAEYFNAVRRSGYHPATLLGLTAVGCLTPATYWRGEQAIPLVLFLSVVFGLLWYLTAPQDRAVSGLSSTLLGIAWIGVLGSFAALILKAPDGVSFFLLAVIGTVAYDIGAYAVGRSAGRQPLSTASPNKTVEGLVGGCIIAVVAIMVAAGFAGLAESAFDGFGKPLILGIVIAVVAPLGDLSESLIKRDLGIKDMGSVLPGHGGLLDRFDALVFVLPATYYTLRVFDFI